MAQQVVSPIVNFLGFKLCASFRIVFDHIIFHAGQKSELISVIEPIFPGAPGLEHTFHPVGEFEPVEIDPNFVAIPQIRVALEELSTALNRPMLTPMHCYIALEYIRELYSGDDEKERWTNMRTALRISREAFREVEQLAKDQKHGKIEYVSWEQRKRCLRVAWETVNRQILLKGNSSADFPFLN